MQMTSCVRADQETVRPAREALRSRGQLATWAKAETRLSPDVWPEPQRRFTLDRGASVFTMGSCFARNIEEHLAIIGCDVPTLEFSVSELEWRARPNGILNKYTPAAIFQELDWAARGLEAGGLTSALLGEMRHDLADGRVVDLQLGGYKPVTPERYEERRLAVFELATRAFSVECVVLTLGLIEAWRDRRTGLFVQQPPASREMLPSADDFEFVVLHYEACLDYLQKSIALLRSRNPEVKILITTSPVPMESTFTEDDVIIANTTSKATLRAVAAAALRDDPLVDYFPSYESATLSPHEHVFREDRQHVRDAFVGAIVGRLIEHYFDGVLLVEKQLQSAAAELGSGRKVAELRQCEELCRNPPTLSTLSDDQLVAYLRVAWRMRRRQFVRAIGKEILARPTRRPAHFRVIRHIFPRNGLDKAARKYARELLRDGPERLDARQFLDETNAAPG